MPKPLTLKRSNKSLIRPLIRRLHPYVPGEQPKVKNLVKLNTNENPYPPAPGILSAVRAAVDGRLRLYPSPTAEPLREKLAALHRCSAENIIVGNGSDELLAMAVRCFVEPSSTSRKTDPKATVQFFTPSYSLYPVLTQIHGSQANAVPLRPDFSIPELAAGGGAGWIPNAALTFITTPNAPSGRAYRTRDLDRICRAHRGVMVFDEAYVDFAQENALSLALRYPHVLVARTFSKAYSLCFQRVGYFVGSRKLIESLQKIRDSYNVNGLGQVAAAATLEHLDYYRANFRRIISTRQSLTHELSRLGFEVLPSETNFILTQPPAKPAKYWLEQLRSQKVLVRWFDQPGIRQYLRISIGTEAEITALLRAAQKIMRS